MTDNKLIIEIPTASHSAVYPSLYSSSIFITMAWRKLHLCY